MLLPFCKVFACSASWWTSDRLERSPITGTTFTRLCIIALSINVFEICLKDLCHLSCHTNFFFGCFSFCHCPAQSRFSDNSVFLYYLFFFHAITASIFLIHLLRSSHWKTLHEEARWPQIQQAWMLCEALCLNRSFLDTHYVELMVGEKIDHFNSHPTNPKGTFQNTMTG